MIRLSRFFGFKAVTISEALAAPFGRFVCFTIDGADRDIELDIAPCLARHRVPATLFVDTGANAAHTTWDGLKALTARGWEIGAQGHATVNLTLRSQAEQRELVATAKTILATELGVAPRIFAYPFGAYDATTVSCVKEAGFAAAVTLRGGINAWQDDEALHLKRLPLSGHPLRDAVVLLRTIFAKGPTRVRDPRPPSPAQLATLGAGGLTMMRASPHSHIDAGSATGNTRSALS